MKDVSDIKSEISIGSEVHAERNKIIFKEIYKKNSFVSENMVNTPSQVAIPNFVVVENEVLHRKSG